MKHFTLVCIAALFACSAQGQVIFESSFENWTGTAPNDTPDGWMGSKTQLDTASVEQVSMDVQEGTYAARLIQPEGTHQRFTTQTLTVEDGVVYQVNFWARGAGEVRLGLFDGRTGNGYASYTNYEVVSSTTWQEVTLSIAAANDTTGAEFILSVRNTMDPEHLVIDDLTITAGGIVEPPVDITIQEIQTTTASDGASPMVGNTVNTGGVITGFVGGTFPGFFIQDGSGAWSGIYVFQDHGTLQAGDQITLSGVVAEFNGQTQLTNITNLMTVSSGNTVTSVNISTADANTEPYESVLVTVQDADVTAAGTFGQFTVNDGTGAVLVDDVFYAYPFVVGNAYNITGVLQYAFSEWRILPRDVNDVELSTSIAETGLFSGTRIFPNPCSDVVTIELPILDQRTEFQLLDASGRMVASNIITSDRGMIDVAALPNGIYALTLRSAGSVWSTRVVVAR